VLIVVELDATKFRRDTPRNFVASSSTTMSTMSV